MPAYKEQIQRFYRKFAPNSQVDTDKLLKKYKGSETTLLSEIYIKYLLADENGDGTGTPFSEAVTRLYARYAPDKSEGIPGLISKFQNSPEKLITGIVNKYEFRDVDTTAPTAISHKSVLTDIYRTANPNKVGEVDALLEKYKGQEGDLVKAVKAKYKPQTTSSTATPPIAIGASFKSKLTDLYRRHNPGKVAEVDALAAKYRDNQSTLLAAIEAKYHPKRNELVSLYEKYNPNKVGDVDSLLIKYKGKEDKLIQKIKAKYEAVKESMTETSPPSFRQPPAPAPKEVMVESTPAPPTFTPSTPTPPVTSTPAPKLPATPIAPLSSEAISKEEAPAKEEITPPLVEAKPPTPVTPAPPPVQSTPPAETKPPEPITPALPPIQSTPPLSTDVSSEAKAKEEATTEVETSKEGKEEPTHATPAPPPAEIKPPEPSTSAPKPITPAPPPVHSTPSPAKGDVTPIPPPPDPAKEAERLKSQQEVEARQRAEDEAKRKVKEEADRMAAADLAAKQQVAEVKQKAAAAVTAAKQKKEAAPKDNLPAGRRQRLWPPETGQAGKKMNLTPIFIIVGIVIILGGGAGGYYYKFGWTIPFMSDSSEVKEKEKESDKKSTIKKKKKTEEPKKENEPPKLKIPTLITNEAPSVETSGEPEVEEEIIEEPKVEEEVEASPEPTPKPKPAPSVPSKSLKYHLAAGSFTVEQNARDLHTQLKSKGYDAVYLGRIGEYYKVSYQSFKNEADAKAALQSLNDKGVSSWLMKHELK